MLGFSEEGEREGRGFCEEEWIFLLLRFLIWGRRRGRRGGSGEGWFDGQKDD